MRTAAFQAAARAACLNALDSEAAPFLANALRPRWARSQSLTAAILAAARAACSNARDSDSTRFPATALRPTWARSARSMSLSEFFFVYD